MFWIVKPLVKHLPLMEVPTCNWDLEACREGAWSVVLFYMQYRVPSQYCSLQRYFIVNAYFCFQRSLWNHTYGIDYPSVSLSLYRCLQNLFQTDYNVIICNQIPFIKLQRPSRTHMHYCTLAHWIFHDIKWVFPLRMHMVSILVCNPFLRNSIYTPPISKCQIIIQSGSQNN